MARGKNRQYLVNSEGKVNYDNATTYDFIYKASTTKDPNYNVGDLVRLPDGRELRYALSGSALCCAEACYHVCAGIVPYTSATTTIAVSATSLTIPAATHVALAKDKLRGGYIQIFGSATDDADSQFRGIIGNDATAADVAFTLYLDGPTDVEIDTSHEYEVWGNPWDGVYWDSGAYRGKAGVPAAYCSAASTYVWIQTRGPKFCNPQSGVLNSTYQVGLFWRCDGSLQDANTALATTIAQYTTSQYAGYIIGGDYSGNGPLFMLQGQLKL